MALRKIPVHLAERISIVYWVVSLITGTENWLDTTFDNNSWHRCFFALVGSGYVNLSELPGAGMVTLIDMANGLAIVTIFLTLPGSFISARITGG